MFGGELLAVAHQPVERAFLQILRGREDEFRLAGVLLRRLARNDEIRQRQIGRQAAHRGVERGARHAGRLRLRPQRLQELIERRIGAGA